MDLDRWLLIAVVLVAFLVPFVVYLSFRARGRRNPAREEVESGGVLPEEWELAHRQGHLRGSQTPPTGHPDQPHDDACEVSVALFMERYWQRLSGGRPPLLLDRARRWVIIRLVTIAILMLLLAICRIFVFRALIGLLLLAAVLPSSKRHERPRTRRSSPAGRS